MSRVWQLWITRLESACSELGIDYYALRTELKEADIAVNAKVLQMLAVHEPRTFRVSPVLTAIL